MASNTSPVFEKEPFNDEVSYTNSDSANTKKTLIAAADVPAEGMRIDAITITSTETANARVFAFYINDGSTDYRLGSVNVPLNSGFDGSVPAVDAMSVLSPVLGYITLMDTDVLKVENLTQVASGKQVDIIARGGKLTA